MLDYINAPGRIYDIQGYAVHDGPGIRTTVYTKGCPLRCLWCHSPESQRRDFELGYLPVKCLGADICEDDCIKACPEGAISRDKPVPALDGSGDIQKIIIDRAKCTGCMKCAEACICEALYTAGWDTTVDEVYDRVMKDVSFFADGGGITISGGEAMAQFDFTLNLAKRLKDSGIHICLDTTGFAPTAHFEEIMPYIDLFLYDIKHMDGTMHKKLTGTDNEIILKNARFLAEHGAALQIRFPIIPRLNDQETNIRKTAEFCASLGESVKLVQLLPYHKAGRSKYDRLGWHYRLRRVEPPDEAFMQKTLEFFQGMGLNAQIH